MGQESGYSLAGCLWLNVAHKVAANLLTGTEGSTQKRVFASKLIYVVVGLVPCNVGLSTGLPHKMSWLLSDHVIQESKESAQEGCFSLFII